MARCDHECVQVHHRRTFVVSVDESRAPVRSCLPKGAGECTLGRSSVVPAAQTAQMMSHGTDVSADPSVRSPKQPGDGALDVDAARSEFLHEWGYLVKESGKLLPTRGAVALFGSLRGGTQPDPEAGPRREVPRLRAARRTSTRRAGSIAS
jgi:hypothetical protein